MKQAPTVDRLLEIESLAFSDIWKFRGCVLEAWPKSRMKISDRSQAPFSRARFVGDFFHELLSKFTAELTESQNNDPNHVRRLAVSLLEEHREKLLKTYPDDISGLDYWPEISEIVDSAIDYKLAATVTEAKISSEVFVMAPLIKAHGILDEVQETASQLKVIEYKTTSKPERLLSERNIAQVHFYALLVGQNTSKTVKLELRGLRGNRAAVEIDEILLLRQEEKLQTFFSLLEHINLDRPITATNPDRSRCPSCNRRFSCPALLSPHPHSHGSGFEQAVLENIEIHAHKVTGRVIGGTIPVGAYVVDGLGIDADATFSSDSIAVVDRMTIEEGRILKASPKSSLFWITK